MTTKILYWTPRGLAILAILFVMIFSFDCFETGEPLGKALLCFLIHNIPAWIFVAALIFAWKLETAGGLIFILLFIAAGIYFNSFTSNKASLIVIFPFLLTGALFILHDQLSKKAKTRI